MEHDEQLVASLASLLSREGYRMVAAQDGSRGLALALRGDFAANLLDLTLPSLDGLKLLTALRSERIHTPVLVISGRSDELDKVMGVDLGADDYRTKPFSPAELAARLRVLLRRSQQGERVALGRYTLDLARRVLVLGEEAVAVSPNGLGVLVALVHARGAVLSREELFALFRPGRKFGSRRVVDNAVLELRRLLEEDPDRPKLIVTVRGMGYRVAWENLPKDRA